MPGKASAEQPTGESRNYANYARIRRPSTALRPRPSQNRLSIYPRKSNCRLLPSPNTTPTHFFSSLCRNRLRGRAQTSAPSSHSTLSSPRALRPTLRAAASRLATSMARTLPPRLSSSPCWRFSDLGTPSTTRVSGSSFHVVPVFFTYVTSIFFFPKVHLSTFYHLTNGTCTLLITFFVTRTEHHKNHAH